MHVFVFMPVYVICVHTGWIHAYKDTIYTHTKKIIHAYKNTYEHIQMCVCACICPCICAYIHRTFVFCIHDTFQHILIIHKSKFCFECHLAPSLYHTQACMHAGMYVHMEGCMHVCYLHVGKTIRIPPCSFDMIFPSVSDDVNVCMFACILHLYKYDFPTRT